MNAQIADMWNVHVVPIFIKLTPRSQIIRFGWLCSHWPERDLKYQKETRILSARKMVAPAYAEHAHAIHLRYRHVLLWVLACSITLKEVLGNLDFFNLLYGFGSQLWDIQLTSLWYSLWLVLVATYEHRNNLPADAVKRPSMQVGQYSLAISNVGAEIIYWRPNILCGRSNNDAEKQSRNIWWKKRANLELFLYSSAAGLQSKMKSRSWN